MTEQDQTMPTETPRGRVRVGDKLHVLVGGYVFAGTVWRRGSVFEVTPEMIAGSVDRLGRSNLDSAGDEGSPLGIGEWPAGEPVELPGSPEFFERRETMRRAAFAEVDPDIRARKLREVNDQFGPGPTTSIELNRDRDKHERAWIEADNRRRLAARPVHDYAPEARP